MQAPRTGSRWSWAGRFPTALLAGVLIVFATPVVGAGPDGVEILGVSDIVAAPPPVLAAARIADPGGQAAIPDRRFAPPPDSLTGYRWPLRKARLTLPFGPTPWGSRIVNGKLFHDGMDLATFCGDRIVAAHDGTVLAAGRHYDEFLGWVGDLTAYTARLNEKHLWLTLPNVVVIDDGNGYRSIYAHFRGVAVKPGDVVKAGDFLGWEGQTGHATGCHLHYGLFSPDTSETFGYDPVGAAHMKLPTEELARIDPLGVLPPPATAGIH
jgi:murein DD-endopeptidase MepM/ murein hydrolase activator NlpD